MCLFRVYNKLICANYELCYMYDDPTTLINSKLYSKVVWIVWKLVTKFTIVCLEFFT